MGKFNGNHKTDTTDIGDARISAKSGSMGTNRPFIHNFRGENHGTHWKTAGNGFTNCHNIRHNVEVLACPHFAGTSVATLDFVENQENSMVVTNLADTLYEFPGRNDIAAFAHNRLHINAGNIFRIDNIFQ